jgi:hypothetical protein
VATTRVASEPARITGVTTTMGGLQDRQLRIRAHRTEELRRRRLASAGTHGRQGVTVSPECLDPPLIADVEKLGAQQSVWWRFGEQGLEPGHESLMPGRVDRGSDPRQHMPTVGTDHDDHSSPAVPNGSRTSVGVDPPGAPAARTSVASSGHSRAWGAVEGLSSACVDAPPHVSIC